MFSLARAVGAGIPFALDRELVMLYPLRLCDFGAAENYLLLGRSTAAAMTCVAATPGKLISECPEGVYKAIGESASLPLRDIVAWMNTGFGITMSLWMCLRGQRTWEQACLVAHAWEGGPEALRFIEARNQISGIDRLSEHEWARAVLDEDAIPDQDDEEARPINWKKGVRIACDMGQCSLADVGNLTLFQYREANATEKQLDKEQAGTMTLAEHQEMVRRKAQKKLSEPKKAGRGKQQQPKQQLIQPGSQRKDVQVGVARISHSRFK